MRAPRRSHLWLLAMPLLGCLLLAVQAVQAVRYVERHGGLEGLKRTLVSGKPMEGGRAAPPGAGGPPPFTLVVSAGFQAETAPDLVALADSLLALEDRPRLALTAEQKDRLRPLVAGLYRCWLDLNDARDGILGALSPRQAARLAEAPGFGSVPPVEEEEHLEALLARRILERLDEPGGLGGGRGGGDEGEPGARPGAYRHLAGGPPATVLEAMDRELADLHLDARQREKIRESLRRVLRSEEQEVWVKDRIREVFRPGQMAWLERRNRRVDQALPSPMRPLFGDWLRRRAAGESGPGGAKGGR